MAEKLRKTRQGHKLCVTNLIKTSRKLIEQIKEDQDDAKLVKLESKRNTLIKQTEEVKQKDEIETEIMKTCEEILKVIKEDEIETEIMKTCDFTEETEQLLVIIDKLFKENTQISCTTEGPKLMNPSHSPSTGVSDNSKDKIKLPKLEIKKFSGNPGEWVTFWDSFQSAIRTNEQLTDTQKFQYLKMYVDKTATDTISGLQLTSSNC